MKILHLENWIEIDVKTDHQIEKELQLNKQAILNKEIGYEVIVEKVLRENK